MYILGRSGDRIPAGRDFPPVQTGPGAHPASCTMGTRSFPGVKYDQGVLLTTHPLLVPWSWKSRPIPLPILWATTRPATGTHTRRWIPVAARSKAWDCGRSLLGIAGSNPARVINVCCEGFVFYIASG